MSKKWYPTWYAKKIFDIDFNVLKESGIKHILCDLDNTIVPYHVVSASEGELKWFEELKGHGFTLAIVSNNYLGRVKKFASEDNIEYLANSNKPTIRRIKKFILKGEINKDEWVFIGDQILTDIWAANRLGIRSILVEPLVKRESIRSFINRKLDNKIRKKILKDKDKISIEKGDLNE